MIGMTQQMIGMRMTVDMVRQTSPVIIIYTITVHMIVDYDMVISMVYMVHHMVATAARRGR